jgi:hypothetical protein
VNSGWPELALAAMASIPLIAGILSAFALAGFRVRPPSSVAAQPSKAEQRANMLLTEWLGPGQRLMLQSLGYFEVIGSHSGKCYRIRRGRQMNIEELGEDGTPIGVRCFGPIGNLPLGDVMLTQKLALEINELAALAVANRVPRA